VRITKQARREAKQLFRAAVVNGVLDDTRARKVVQLLLEKKPRGYLAVLTHFQRLLQLDIERRSARIESAQPLSAENQATVKQNLSGVYGQGLTYAFTDSPALIGGLRIKVGSDVYDGTVRGRLDRLQDSF
jgi:F-type H+-transporting ATPase subunit delta